MIDRQNIYQSPDEIIDISAWGADGEYEVFPVGARDKSLLICPADAPQFCLPGHRYLFKLAMSGAKDPSILRHPDQYWAEIIAFKIGRLMGLDVPPAFAAYDSRTNTAGALIEWFIGYQEDVSERFTPGGDHMQSMIPDFDREKGRQHNLDSVLLYSRALSVSNRWKFNTNWREYWGLCLCYDAVIGNTDRHQENWGVLWNDVDQTVRLSPFFDNGTSLGHELYPDRFKKCLKDANMLRAYIRRGCHHMSAKLGDRRMPLIKAVVDYCKVYKSIVPRLIECLSWSDDELMDILRELTVFDMDSSLTEDRALFVHKLTCERKRSLQHELERL